MRSKVFAITAPGRIEESERDANPEEGQKLIRPIFTGICKSDINYFEGHRPHEVLEKAYPLVPFHEAVVEKIEDDEPTGDFFVPVPNIPCSQPGCPACGEGGAGSNYCPETRFASSNAEGFARTIFPYPTENLSRVSGIPLDVACLTEPFSVVIHAIEEADIKGGMRVCTIGDGPLGLMQALVASYRGVPRKDNGLFGLSHEKLALASEYASTNNAQTISDQPESQYDIVFECVGNRHQGQVIAQAAKLLRPGGRLIILGLSDDTQGIQLRPLMKKRIKLEGVMRSRPEHFGDALSMLGQDIYQERAKAIIGGTHNVYGTKDIEYAFRNRFIGRTLLDWSPMYKGYKC